MPKKIPDHSTLRAKNNGRSVILDADIQQLREDYKFRDDYDLGEHLAEAEMWYYADDEYYNQPSVKNQLVLIDEVSKSASRLNDALSKLGTQELNAMPPDFHIDSLDEMKDWLVNLSRMAADAYEYIDRLADQGIKKRKRGPRSNNPERELISKLKDIYEAGTGRRAGYTQSSGDFFGQFVIYVVDVFLILNIDKSQTAIGEIIKEII